MLEPYSSEKTRTAGILVGLVIAVIAATLLTPISEPWRTLEIVLIVVVALLNLAYLVGLNIRISRWSRQRIEEGKISSHPDFPLEFYRLIESINRVLFENAAEHSSLTKNGAEVLKALSASDLEFEEKLRMLEGSFRLDYNNYADYYRSQHKWKTIEFVNAIGKFSIFLTSVNQITPTFDRFAQNNSVGSQSKQSASQIWESFRTEYNSVLQEWNTFVERSIKTLQRGGPTGTKPIEPLHVS